VERFRDGKPASCIPHCFFSSKRGLGLANCNQTKSSSLPPLYNDWMEELLGSAPPEETRATCSDCAMLPQPGELPTDQKVFFDPKSKCCTYLPDLPNFLVGRIFRDASPEMARGRESVEKRMAARIAVTPLGIGQPSSYLLWYNNSKSGFGRSQTLRCPHYIEEGGLCSIWRHREGTCATWFCKYDRGAAGFRLWRDGIHALLKTVEATLAGWCVLQLDMGSTAIESILALSDNPKTIEDGELEGKVQPAEYQKFWGRWAGKEREFYEACAERVEGFRWADVVRICGPKVGLLARLTQDISAQLSRTSPEPALRCGSFKLISLRAGVARLSTYSEYDPVEIPARLLEVLQHFDGQPTSEAIATIAERENVTLNPELVRKLTDFALLVPPTDSGNATAAAPSSDPAKSHSADPAPKQRRGQ